MRRKVRRKRRRHEIRMIHSLLQRGILLPHERAFLKGAMQALLWINHPNFIKRPSRSVARPVRVITLCEWKGSAA